MGPGSHYNARVRSRVYIVNMVNILTTRTHEPGNIWIHAFILIARMIVVPRLSTVMCMLHEALRVHGVCNARMLLMMNLLRRFAKPEVSANCIF